MAQLSKFDIEMFAKRAAESFVAHGRSLNESISDMAETQGWNREQVKRVVESANVITNGELVRRAKTAGSDPRVTFPLADSAVVLAARLAQTPRAKEAEERRGQKLADMFHVPTARDKPALEKVADRPRRLSPLSGPDLAAVCVRGGDASGVGDDDDVTMGQLVDARASIEEIAAVTRQKWAECVNQETGAWARFDAEVEAQAHAGLTPATLKAIIARADAGDEVQKHAAAVIDAVADRLGKSHGTSQVKTASIVDEQHPVFVAVFDVLRAQAAKGEVVAVAEKVAAAATGVDAEIVRAHTEGLQKVALAPLARQAIRGAPGIVGKGLRAVGLASDVVDVKNRAAQATQRLRRMQATPAVGAMKMAETEKTAFNPFKGIKPGVGTVLTAAALGAALTGGTMLVGKGIEAASSRIGSVFERRRRDRTWEQLIAREPGLKQNPRARELFDLAMTYAPALGDHPLAIADFLKRMLSYPATGVEFIQGLATLQKTIADSRRKGPSMALDSAHRAIGSAQGHWLSEDT